MKVILTQEGGFAAGIRLPAKAVDESSLSPADGQELRRLVLALRAAPSQENSPGRARDAITYILTIENEAGGKSGSAAFVARQNELAMTPQFKELRDFVLDHAAT